jgi:hypothetical protein
MKNLFLFLGLMIVSNLAFGQGDAPPILQGQGSSTKIVAPKIFIPNQLATKVVGGALIENGNKNILQNPSFEGFSFGVATGWSFTNILSYIQESSVVFDGKSSNLLQPPNQALNFKQDSTLYAAQFADGVPGLAYMQVKTLITSSPIYVCPRQAGNYPAQMTTGCKTVIADGKWHYYEQPFTLGGTSNGIGITSNGVAVTGDIYIDDAFVGPTSVNRSLPGMRFLGTLQYPGTAGCNWTTPGGTPPANFTANASCPTPNVTGSVAAPSTKIPAFVLPDGVGTGELMIVMNAAINGTGAGNGCAFRISDGTNTSFISTAVDIDTSAGGLGSATYRLPRTSSAAATYQLQGGCDSGTGTVNNATANRYETAFSVYLIPSGSPSGYSTTNANYSRTTWTPTFTGFGSVTVSDCYHSRDGQYLDIDCKFTSGTSTAVEAQVSLPVVNGVQLTTATSTGTRVAAGLTARSNTSGTNAFTTLMQSNVGYLNFALTNSASSPLTPQNGNILTASGDLVSIAVRIPISQWDNSNIIIGQFNGLESCSNSAQCETTYYADISATAAVSGQEITFISGCTLSTNTFTCTYSTPFAQTPMCEITPGVGATQAQKTAESASSISYIVYNATGSPTNVAHSISCRKRGSDYVTKTARAVASDQNLAIPGFTKAKACYAAYGGTSTTLTSPTVCAASPCIEVIDTCGVFTPPTRLSAGNYGALTIANGTFAPNSFLNCSCQGYATANQGRSCYNLFNTGGNTWMTNSSGGFVTDIFTGIVTGTGTDAYFNIKCEGQAP